MLILILFAFIGGIVTILSPCILPILPIVLSSSLSGGHKRPLGVITGFIVSFTFFTLFLSSLVQATGLGVNTLRFIAVIVIFLFGLIMVVPQLQAMWERFASRLASHGPQQKNKEGFSGGLLIGLSLGLIWAPCVGPILASVITLAATGNVTGTAVIVTLAYTLGTSLPMLGIIYGGRRLLNIMPVLNRNAAKIQQIFGVFMILTAVAIYFNLDRKFQTYILEAFPQYGTGLTQIEDNPLVEQQLDELSPDKSNNTINSSKNQLNNDAGRPSTPGFQGGGNWLNSDPLVLEELSGQVVLVDFWTYSCINCIRTLPYLRSWHDKYQDDGLVIIGVHTPEFEFEKDLDNLKQAVADFKLQYPIVQDNDYKIWRAYENRYWPAKYLIDKNGRIRYTHFGEGKYQETEMEIQKLLAEDSQPIPEELTTLKDFDHQTRTPETYLGYQRARAYHTSPEIKKDQLTRYAPADSIALNQVTLDGEWKIASESAQPSAGSSLTIRFDAKQVNLVIDTADQAGTLTLELDGQPILPALAGDHVENGQVTIDKAQLYNLVNLEHPGQHTLTLTAKSDTLQLFAFTFG